MEELKFKFIPEQRVTRESFVFTEADGNTMEGEVWILIRGKSAEIGYRVPEYARGRGICTKLVETLCSRAFAEHAELQQIEATVHPANAASIRVLEKCGFQAGELVEVSGPDLWPRFTLLRRTTSQPHESAETVNG